MQKSLESLGFVRSTNPNLDRFEKKLDQIGNLVSEMQKEISKLKEAESDKHKTDTIRTSIPNFQQIDLLGNFVHKKGKDIVNADYALEYVTINEIADKQSKMEAEIKSLKIENESLTNRLFEANDELCKFRNSKRSWRSINSAVKQTCEKPQDINELQNEIGNETEIENDNDNTTQLSLNNIKQEDFSDFITLNNLTQNASEFSDQPIPDGESPFGDTYLEGKLEIKQEQIEYMDPLLETQNVGKVNSQDSILSRQLKRKPSDLSSSPRKKLLLDIDQLEAYNDNDSDQEEEEEKNNGDNSNDDEEKFDPNINTDELNYSLQISQEYIGDSQDPHDSSLDTKLPLSEVDANIIANEEFIKPLLTQKAQKISLSYPKHWRSVNNKIILDKNPETGGDWCRGDFEFVPAYTELDGIQGIHKNNLPQITKLYYSHQMKLIYNYFHPKNTRKTHLTIGEDNYQKYSNEGLLTQFDPNITKYFTPIPDPEDNLLNDCYLEKYKYQITKENIMEYTKRYPELKNGNFVKLWEPEEVALGWHKSEKSTQDIKDQNKINQIISKKQALLRLWHTCFLVRNGSQIGIWRFKNKLLNDLVIHQQFVIDLGLFNK